ncbi:peptidase C14 [Penicillium herquei]|nr:peptidase C14 [Penicillium herquei]
MNANHSGLNKFPARTEKRYQDLKSALEAIIAPSELERADKALRETHYGGEDSRCLRIERISGDALSLDQCYINLAIVRQDGKDGTFQSPSDIGEIRSSLLARQKAETPDRKLQIDLSGIFDPFTVNETGSDRTLTVYPRRLLIRGRAGVGKTTVCKKMVHDFISNEQTALKRLFDRVLWVPLRNLKKSQAPTNLQDLIFKEFFENKVESDQGHKFAQRMEQEIEETGARRILFILDGLDEVIHELEEYGDTCPLLLALLSKPNVIITSRPNARLPGQVAKTDLELETVGFYPDQVNEYLKNHPGIRDHQEQIRSFLQRNWLLQGLMRIPIQLEALCYTWEGQTDPTPTTITSIYQAIERKLWRKDVFRLQRLTQSSAQSTKYSDILGQVPDELRFLEFLAFNGLCNGVVEFNPEDRSLIEQNRNVKVNPPSDKTLAELSFIRTSDPSSKIQDRSYHFIHLTFQEYFAARYFVQMGGKKNIWKFVLGICPKSFLSQHKYSSQYDVFWRFVAGLLSDDSNEIARFFDQLSCPPRDLLGPSHQRLIMHCLSQVSSHIDLQCRQDLERHLAQWVVVEHHNRETTALTRTRRLKASLASQAEMPEGSLAKVLEDANDKT